jgi:hypothetical protein
MIAGIVLAYRGKYLLGLVVTTIFAAFEIKANHVQMTYYYLFVIAAMVIAYMIEGIRQKNYRHLLKATAVCVVAALIAVCLNISNLYHTWQYSKESMRSASELVKKNASNQTSSGLDRDYITQWSYGIDETWTLLVPNTKGGASVPLSDSKIAMQHADNYYLGIYQQLGQYWGNQPMTAGPVYVGAFVLMLFVLGLFVVKGPMKWALLVVTILSILLSWGRNFMPFTDFFLDYVPMYAKFRTVASILVIAEFTIPLLAMLALKKIVDEPELLKEKAKWLYISFVLTGGVALLFALMPKLFFPDFISVSELQAMAQIPADQAAPLIQNLTEMRVAVFTADCWRSFWIIVIGTACLLLYKYRKIRVEWMTAALVVLCLFDMWQVNKRYLNDSMFVPATVREAPIAKTQAIDHILQDKSLDFRVLNLATSTFNENETSFYLKSIGGYHAAKLRRYQELVDAYIQKEMSGVISAISKAGGDMTQVKGDSVYPVLNMLNTKYFILPLQGGQSVPLENPYTYGNAWFVNHVRYVANANEELDAIGSLDLRHEAVADQKFKEQLGESVPQDTVSLSFVRIKTYEPNQLTYEVESAKGGVVVFSEIYYPGWTATVDGVEQTLGRVNYVLRALQVKPGKHEVVLSFFPKSIDHTETIAYISYVVLLLLILWLGWTTYRRRRQA